MRLSPKKNNPTYYWEKIIKKPLSEEKLKEKFLSVTPEYTLYDCLNLSKIERSFKDNWKDKNI